MTHRDTETPSTIPASAWGACDGTADLQTQLRNINHALEIEGAALKQLRLDLDRLAAQAGLEAAE